MDLPSWQAIMHIHIEANKFRSSIAVCVVRRPVSPIATLAKRSWNVDDNPEISTVRTVRDRICIVVIAVQMQARK